MLKMCNYLINGIRSHSKNKFNWMFPELLTYLSGSASEKYIASPDIVKSEVFLLNFPSECFIARAHTRTCVRYLIIAVWQHFHI